MIVVFIMVGAIRSGLFKARLHVFLMDKVAMDKKGKECHNESKADEDVPDLVEAFDLLQEFGWSLSEALESLHGIMVPHKSRLAKIGQFHLRTAYAAGLLHFKL